MITVKKENMKHLIYTLALVLVFTACTSKRGGKAKISNDLITTTIITSDTDSASYNSVDGIYIGQKISEFIFQARQQYDVKKEIMQLEGDDYDIYNVYENGEKIYSVEPVFDNPDVIWRVWIYSPKFKTEKGIGVGSTFAEIKSKYHIEYIQTEGEGGLGVSVKEVPIGFMMDNSKLPKGWWERMDNEEIPESLPIEEIIIVGDKNVYITLDNRIIVK